MRVIFIAFKLNFDTGGGACYELDLKINALLKLGHTATVVTLFSSQNKLPAGLKYKVVEEQVKSCSLLDIQKKVFNLLRRHQDDANLFHVDGQFGYGSGWYRARGGTVPVVVHFNRELSSFPDSTRRRDFASAFSIKKRSRFLVERLCFFPIMNKNDLFTFTSPILQELYVKHGLERNKTMVTPDFFDSQKILQGVDRRQVLNSRVQSKQSTTILSGGRMVREKGLDVVIRALAKINNPERFRLIITGDGPEKDNLLRLTQELKIEKLVDFTGWVSKEENYNLFKQADIYVVPRWRPELTSMIVLEAMSFMVPYIVTKDTALAWQAQDSALVYNDEDDADLADKIEKLVSNSDLRGDLIKKGLQRLEDFNCDRLARQLGGAMENLLGGFQA